MKTEGTYTSKLHAHVRYFLYEPKIVIRVKAIVILCHDFGEDAQTYDHFASYLLNLGFVVVTSDMIGHGVSLLDFEQGYFGEGKVTDLVVEDLHHLQLIVSDLYTDIPIFMCGIGIGGLLVRKYASVYGDHIEGMILMSSPIQFDHIDFVEARMAVASLMKGPLYHPRRMMKRIRKHWSSGMEGNEYAFMTHDEALQKFMKQDTLTYFTCTIKGYQDIFSLLREVNTKQVLDAAPERLGVYILGGDEDPIIHKGTDVTTLARMYENARLNDVKYKIYTQRRHSLLQDTDRLEVYKDIVNWLAERTYL